MVTRFDKDEDLQVLSKTRGKYECVVSGRHYFSSGYDNLLSSGIGSPGFESCVREMAVAA